MQRILLVEPDFPIPNKSRNHKNFLPIGLLKIASYLMATGHTIKLVWGIPKTLEDQFNLESFNPDEVWVTSLFTYWADYVREAVQYYKGLFPAARVIVGGIYASLHTKEQVKAFTGCDEVHQGVMPEAEKYAPAYDLIEELNGEPIDYQIIHASRGCKRKCEFCGTWIIEPKFKTEKSIKDRVTHKKLVFYDNNLLMNPHIESILEELAELKKEKNILWCESQSGLDGRILVKKPHLAKMLKNAGFRYPRIAWDWGLKEHTRIKKQLDILTEAKYPAKDLYVFMIYNWEIGFEEMEKKRIKCYEWGVQIADCRHRPFSQLHDHYKAMKMQTSEDYYIDERWTDAQIKQFRRNVRQQNICVRQGLPFYSNSLEHMRVDKETVKKAKAIQDRKTQEQYLRDLNIDFWYPGGIRPPKTEIHHAEVELGQHRLEVGSDHTQCALIVEICPVTNLEDTV